MILDKVVPSVPVLAVEMISLFNLYDHLEVSSQLSSHDLVSWLKTLPESDVSNRPFKLVCEEKEVSDVHFDGVMRDELPEDWKQNYTSLHQMMIHAEGIKKDNIWFAACLF